MSKRIQGRNNSALEAETKGVLLLNPQTSSKIPGGYHNRADQQSAAYRILGDLGQPPRQASFFYGQNPNQMRHLSPYEMINTTDNNKQQVSMNQSNRTLTPRKNRNNFTAATTTTSGYSQSPFNSSSKSPTNGRQQRQQYSLNKQNSRSNIIPIVPPPGTQIVQLPSGKYMAQPIIQPQQTASFRNPSRNPSVSTLGERQDYQLRGRSPSRLIQLTQTQQYHPQMPQPQQYQQSIRTLSNNNNNATNNYTPTRSRIGIDMNHSLMPQYQQTRLNEVLRRSEEEVKDLVEDTIYEEANKLKNEIDYLTTQLRAKDQEVAIYSQYISELRNNLLTTPIGLPQQSQVYQVPQVQSIFQNKPNPSMMNSYVSSQTLQYPQQSSSPINQKYQKYSPYDIDLADDLGRREFQDQQRQNQQQLNVIQNLEKNYGALKRQLQERDYLVAQQQEEIIQYQGKYLKNRRSESESAERVRKLEQENGMCQIKINSLEKNLQLMEQEYRLLKDTQQVSSRYPSYC